MDITEENKAQIFSEIQDIAMGKGYSYTAGASV